MPQEVAVLEILDFAPTFLFSPDTDSILAVESIQLGLSNKVSAYLPTLATTAMYLLKTKLGQEHPRLEAIHLLLLHPLLRIVQVAIALSPQLEALGLP